MKQALNTRDIMDQVLHNEEQIELEAQTEEELHLEMIEFIYMTKLKGENNGR